MGDTWRAVIGAGAVDKAKQKEDENDAYSDLIKVQSSIMRVSLTPK